jgi:cysteine desulfurase
MLVNNETGVIQPVQEASRLAREQGALVHCDAAQAAGRIPVDVLELGVDYLSLSAHKLHGPMGVGSLYIAADAPKPTAQNLGGGQERAIRSGTEPVPLVAGFGAAAELAKNRHARDGLRVAELAEAFRQTLADARVAFTLVSADAPTIGGGFAISLDNVVADDLVDRLAATICISTGSACNSGQVLSSHVLTAMGWEEKASSVIRICFSRYNTTDEATRAAAARTSAVQTSPIGLDEAASEGYPARHEACAH